MKTLKYIGISFVISLLVVSFMGNSTGVGTTITTMLGTDKLSDSRTTINTNLDNLNAGKIEISTTTLPLLTTLTGLTTTGTIGTGVWEGTTIDELFGGTGFSTYATGDILFASASNVLSKLTASSTNEVLTLVGGVPIWRDASVNVAANFSWTGNHSFTTGTFDIATSSQFGVFGGLSPVGSITAYASTTAPAGWVLADGASYDTTALANLFAVVGYSYGGSGSDFNVPDLKGRNILMSSTTPASTNMGQTGGESNHTMTEDELVAHTHTATPKDDSGDGAFGRGSGLDSPQVTTDSTGGGTPFNVLDPYIVLNYIIKY